MSYKTPNFEATGHYYTAWWSFRYRRGEYSFMHSAALIDPEGNIAVRANVGYINRTWECHSGDTVRAKLADKLSREMHFENFSEETAKEVRGLISELAKSQPVPSYSSTPGTRVGYSLSMCCPM